MSAPVFFIRVGIALPAVATAMMWLAIWLGIGERYPGDVVALFGIICVVGWVFVAVGTYLAGQQFRNLIVRGKLD